MSSKKEYIQYLKDLIASNKLAIAINYLSILVNEEDDLRNEAIIHQFRYKNLLENIRLGKLSYETENISINNLASDVLGLLDEIDDSKAKIKSVNGKFITNVPFLSPIELLGRDEEIICINNLLSEYPKLILVNGIGGIGKTSLIMALVNTTKYYNKYSYLAWITIHSTFLESIVLKLQTKVLTNNRSSYKRRELEAPFQEIFSYLKNLPGRKILIFDNLNDHEELIKYKQFFEDIRCHVIVTSRANCSEYFQIEIKQLSIKYCKQLFYKYYHKHGQDEHIENILKLINYHTLLIELISKASNSNPSLEIEKLYKILKREGIKAKELQMKVFSRHAALFSSSEEVVINRYIKLIFNLSKLNFLEKQCLRYFALLPSQRNSFESIIKKFNIDFDFFRILKSFIRRVDEESKEYIELYSVANKEYNAMIRYLKSSVKVGIGEAMEILDYLDAPLESTWERAAYRRAYRNISKDPRNKIGRLSHLIYSISKFMKILNKFFMRKSYYIDLPNKRRFNNLIYEKYENYQFLELSNPEIDKEPEKIGFPFLLLMKIRSTIQLIIHSREIYKSYRFNSKLEDDHDLAMVLDSLYKKGWLIKEGNSFYEHPLIQAVVLEKLQANKIRCSVLGFTDDNNNTPPDASPVLSISLADYLKIRTSLILNPYRDY